MSIQGAAFPDKLVSLNSDKDVHATSKLSKLSSFLEDGIIRFGGRLQHSAVEYDAKHSVILPSHAGYARLLVEDVHRRTGHAG